MIKDFLDTLEVSEDASALVDTIALASLKTLLETCVMSQSDPISDPAELGMDIEALKRVIDIYTR